MTWAVIISSKVGQVDDLIMSSSEEERKHKKFTKREKWRRRECKSREREAERGLKSRNALTLKS